MTERPPFTVAVCTRGRPAHVRACLARLRDVLGAVDEVLVVHNDAHDDGTGGAAAAFGARLVREPIPGLDRARNRALDEARHEFVAFLDDDARAERGWLEALARGFDADDVWCVTGRVLAAELETEAQRLFETCKSFDRGSVAVRFHRGHRSLFFPVRAGVMGTGCNMACRRTAALALGFDRALDVGTPARGCGDLDFFYRVIRAGGMVAYRPDAVVRHVHRISHEALRQLRYDYGVGSAAFAWKWVHDEGDAQAALFLLWKVCFHLAEMVAGGLRLRRWPAGLAWTELRGMFAGPGALARSRLQVSEGAMSG